MSSMQILGAACLDAGLAERDVRLYRVSAAHDVRGSLVPTGVSQLGEAAGSRGSNPDRARR